MRADSDIERAIDAYGDVVWRVCLARSGCQADAQDAFQETFLSYATHEETSFSDGEHLKAWLIRCATNKCIDAHRRSHDVEPIEETSAEFDSSARGRPDEAPDEALWEVNDALRRLPPEQQQAVYLTVCEGYPATEVAKMLDVPVNTVYSWVSRGKERLKEMLS